MTNLKKSGFIIVPLILIFVISACQSATPTEDPSIKITQVANTVVAEITRMAALTPSATATQLATATATLAPPTPTLEQTIVINTPAPTVRPTSGDSKDDNAVYVSDVTYPDGTIVKPGTTFTKIWQVKNTGKTEWPTAYRLVYLGGLHGANEVLNVHLSHTLKPDLTMEYLSSLYGSNGTRHVYKLLEVV